MDTTDAGYVNVTVWCFTFFHLYFIPHLVHPSWYMLHTWLLFALLVSSAVAILLVMTLVSH
jgi:hypothetical protein